jgi:hypothetical protein
MYICMRVCVCVCVCMCVCVYAHLDEENRSLSQREEHPLSPPANGRMPLEPKTTFPKVTTQCIHYRDTLQRFLFFQFVPGSPLGCRGALVTGDTKRFRRTQDTLPRCHLSLPRSCNVIQDNASYCVFNEILYIMHKDMHIHTRIHVHVYVYMYTYMYTYMHDVCVRVCLCTRTCTRAYACVCVCVRAVRAYTQYIALRQPSQKICC